MNLPKKRKTPSLPGRHLSKSRGPVPPEDDGDQGDDEGLGDQEEDEDWDDKDELEVPPPEPPCPSPGPRRKRNAPRGVPPPAEALVERVGERLPAESTDALAEKDKLGELARQAKTLAHRFCHRYHNPLSHTT